MANGERWPKSPSYLRDYFVNLLVCFTLFLFCLKYSPFKECLAKCPLVPKTNFGNTPPEKKNSEGERMLHCSAAMQSGAGGKLSNAS